MKWWNTYYTNQHFFTGWWSSVLVMDHKYISSWSKTLHTKHYEALDLFLCCLNQIQDLTIGYECSFTDLLLIIFITNMDLETMCFFLLLLLLSVCHPSWVSQLQCSDDTISTKYIYLKLLGTKQLNQEG